MTYLLKNYKWLVPAAVLLIFAAFLTAPHLASVVAQLHSANVVQAARLDPQDLSGVPVKDPDNFPGWKYVANGVTVYFFCKPDGGNSRSYMGWQKGNLSNYMSWSDPLCRNTYDDKGIAAGLKSLEEGIDWLDKALSEVMIKFFPLGF